MRGSWTFHQQKMNRQIAPKSAVLVSTISQITLISGSTSINLVFILYMAMRRTILKSNSKYNLWSPSVSALNQQGTSNIVFW